MPLCLKDEPFKQKVLFLPVSSCSWDKERCPATTCHGPHVVWPLPHLPIPPQFSPTPALLSVSGTLASSSFLNSPFSPCHRAFAHAVPSLSPSHPPPAHTLERPSLLSQTRPTPPLPSPTGTKWHLSLTGPISISLCFLFCKSLMGVFLLH